MLFCGSVGESVFWLQLSLNDEDLRLRHVVAKAGVIQW
jgi:hypothetical protein